MPDLLDIPGLAALRAITLGDAGVRLAMLDGRVDIDHECFQGASYEVPDPEAWNGGAESVDWAVEHATAIASEVFGQPGTSPEGIAPDTHGIFVEAFWDVEDGSHDLLLARLIEYVLGLDPDIIHAAHCLPSQSSEIDPILTRALQAAADADVLVVAPSGNDKGVAFCAPADQPSVLAVGGLDDDGSVRHISNHGPAYDGHGVMAWAQDLEVAVPGGGTKRESGTSGAAPQVSAVAALLLAAARDVGMDPSPLEVGRIIRETARPLDDPDDRARAIGGVLDPEAALHALLGDLAPAGVAQSSFGAGGVTAEPAVSTSLRLPSRLFALGQLSVDISDERHRDRLAQRMAPAEPEDTRALAAHLQDVPDDAALVTWVLGLEGRPRFALRPVGPYADDVFARFVEVLTASDGAADGVSLIERVSMPGVVTRRQRLIRDGLRVPEAIVSLPEGINGWRTADLAQAAAVPVAGGKPGDELTRAVAGFLERVYEEHRNDGMLGRDRALNYAATNAVQAALALSDALARGLQLERLEVVKGRFDRPHSQTWDIQALCYDPDDVRRSRRVYVWTIDVASDRPVGVGSARAWAVIDRDDP